MEKNMPDENVKAVIDESTENAAYAKPADSSNDEYVGANSPGLYDEEEKPKKSHIGIVVYLLKGLNPRLKPRSRYGTWMWIQTLTSWFAATI